MSVSLLLPWALAGLAALLLPILIHLARRTVLERLDFAALRWLRARISPRRRPRIEHWPLLILRLLLITALVLCLAQVLLHGYRDLRPVVAVMPGVSAPAIAAQDLPKDARRLWLAEGFSDLGTRTASAPQATTSLLRQLDSELPHDADLIVLATSVFDGSDAQRPQLSRLVDWRIVEGEPGAREPVKESLVPDVALYSDADHHDQIRYIQALSQAWHEASDPLPARALTEALPSRSDVLLVWLASGPLPPALMAWIEQGGTAVLAHEATVPSSDERLFWRASDASLAFHAATLGRGRVVHFDRALTPLAQPELLDATFPQVMRRALSPASAPASRAEARAQTPRDGAAAYPTPPIPLQPWLALLVALLFLAERVLTTVVGRKP